MEEVAYKI